MFLRSRKQGAAVCSWWQTVWGTTKHRFSKKTHEPLTGSTDTDKLRRDLSHRWTEPQTGLLVYPFLPAGRTGEGVPVRIEHYPDLLYSKPFSKRSINSSHPSGSQLPRLDLQQPKQTKEVLWEEQSDSYSLTHCASLTVGHPECPAAHSNTEWEL